MARVFSLKKNSSKYVGNDGIYNVSEDIVEQICQNSKTECFTGISWESLTHEIPRKPIVMTLRIPIMCFAHSSLCGKVSREILAKSTLSSIGA